jgi:pyruvate/oxaloacetate carboxyltransferase
MNKISNRLLMSLVIVSSAFLLKTAYAEQALAPVNYPDQFIIQLPDVDRDTLIERVEILRGQLIQRRQALELMVAEKKLDSSDVIITVLMPGGLLYAGYKKVRYQQAVDELAHVNADIEEFSSDLLAMQYSSTPVFVAQVP